MYGTALRRATERACVLPAPRPRRRRRRAARGAKKEEEDDVVVVDDDDDEEDEDHDHDPRVSYLLNVAAAIAYDFLDILRRRCWSFDNALGVVGGCVRAASFLSDALRDLGEEPATLAIGADVFADVCGAFDAFVDERVARIAKDLERGFADASAAYRGGKNLETFGFDGAGGVRAKNVNAVSFEPTLDYTRRALRLLRAALFFRRDDAELFSRAAAAFASAAGERLVRDVVLGAATWSASGGARSAADADALTGVFGAYGISGRRRGGRGGGVTRRKPAFYAQLATLREAKALLSLDVDAARAFAKTIENGGEASVMDAREKHGVHRSDDDRVRDVILRMV